MRWLFLLFYTFTALGQPQKIDSLEKILASQTDSLRVVTLTELSWNYRNANVDKSIQYAKEGIEIAKSKNYEIFLPKLFNYSGVAYRNQGDYAKALQFFIEAAKLAEKLKNQEQLGFSYQSIGDVNNRQGNYNQAEAYVLRAMAVFRAIDNQRGMAYCYFSLGLIHINQKAFFVAEQQFTKSLNIRIKINDLAGIAACYSQLGNIKQKQNNLDEAIIYINKAHNLFQSLGDIRGVILVKYNLGLTYLQQGKYDLAIEAVQKSLNYANESRSLEFIKQNYKLLADIYAASGNYQKAYEYQNLFFVYGDSLFNQQKNKQFLELKEKFDHEKNTIQIDALTEKNSLQRTLLISLATLLLFLIIFTIYLFKNTSIQKEAALKSEIQTRQIQRQNFELTTLNEEMTLRNQVVEQQNQHLTHLTQVQNKLFSVISHDFRNPLVSLYNSLFIFESNDFSQEEKQIAIEALKAELNQTSNLLDNLLYWTSGQMKNERVNKTNFNFTELITETFALLQPQADKKKVKLTTYQAEPFNIFADKDMIKIVIRNLIHNAIKYSYQNGMIIVNVIPAKKLQDHAIIIVRDNGKGISLENQKRLFGLDHYSTSGTNYEKGNGVGLLLCKDFVEKNGGKIWVESESNKGATFCFSIPTHAASLR